jgi:hypothetical protein
MKSTIFAVEGPPIPPPIEHFEEGDREPFESPIHGGPHVHSVARSSNTFVHDLHPSRAFFDGFLSRVVVLAHIARG